MHSTLTQLLQKLRFDGLMTRIGSFRNGLGQKQQAPHAFWKALIAKFDIPCPAQLRAFADERHEPRIPTDDTVGFK